jgi:putative phage-type endonuclease
VAEVNQTLSRYGVGASEIAAACGISRYRSRYGLWLQKTGRVPEFAGNVHTRLGQLCEPRARQLYSNATGHEVEVPPCSVFHPEHSWARCTPDGRLVSDPGHKLQLKACGYFVGRRIRVEIPIDMLAQCQWELFVDGGHRVDLAVLVGSDELEWERFILGDLLDPQEVFDRATLDIHPIHRSDADIATLFRGAQEFMRMVESDTQPPVDASDECARWLNRKAGGVVAMDATIDTELLAVVDEYRDAYTESRAVEKRLDLAKNVIRARLGEAGANRIRTPDGSILWISKSDGTTQLRAPDAWGKET